jgi:hypothetical protein
MDEVLPVALYPAVEQEREPISVTR